MARAVIQGEDGSNSAVAAQQVLGADVALVCCASFAEAFAALERGEAPVAVLPFENSTAGLVPDVIDRLLTDATLCVTGQTRVSIRFVAAVRPEATRIEQVLAHPMAAAQCRRFLGQTGWRVATAHDTAGAARLVHESSDLSLAALCPPWAAARYGLKVVFEDCGDDSRAVTRFLCVASGPAMVEATHSRALLSALPGPRTQPAQMLAVFAACAVELRAVHTRVEPGSPGLQRYLFELAVGAADPGFVRLLSALKELEAAPRLIGSFTAEAARG